MQRILFIGASGQLGYYFLRKAYKGYVIYPTCNRKMPPDSFPLSFSFESIDIRDYLSLKRYISKIKPSIIIHAASLGDIDYCEKEVHQAWEVNVKGTENLARICKQLECPLIFISSSMVFESSPIAFLENDLRRPLNSYGVTKVVAEDVVRQLVPQHIIVRFPPLFGIPVPEHRIQLTHRIIHHLRNNRPIYLPKDRKTNFMYADHAATMIWHICKRIQSLQNNVFHFGNIDSITLLNYGNIVARVFGYDNRFITSVKSSFFSNLANRPQHIALSYGLAKKLLSYSPTSIHLGLRLLKEEYQVYERLS